MQLVAQPDYLCIVIWILSEGHGRANVPGGSNAGNPLTGDLWRNGMFNPCNLPPWAPAAAKDLRQQSQEAVVSDSSNAAPIPTHVVARTYTEGLPGSRRIVRCEL